VRETPAWHRGRHAGGGGQGERQAAQATNGEKAKTLRLQRVAIPAHGLHRINRTGKGFLQPRHDFKIFAPAAGYQDPPRRFRDGRRGNPRHREGGECGRAIFWAQPRRCLRDQA